jgi:hypothetical protein
VAEWGTERTGTRWGKPHADGRCGTHVVSLVGAYCLPKAISFSDGVKVDALTDIWFPIASGSSMGSFLLSPARAGKDAKLTIIRSVTDL